MGAWDYSQLPTELKLAKTITTVLSVPSYSKIIWTNLVDSWNDKMINGNAYEKGHYISYVAGNIVGTKGAGSAVQTTTKLSKVGKVVEGGTAATHVNKGINKGKSYLHSFVKNKNDLALVGIAQDVENTYNAKNTPLLKSMIEDKKESVLRRSERSNNKGTGEVNKLKIEDFTKEILETKPMNSPIPEKWYKKGGSISIEDNGTWTYTNKSGTSVSYPNGYPDFTPFMHPNVKPVKIEVHSPKNNPKDFENANKAARLTKDTDPPIIILEGRQTVIRGIIMKMEKQ